MAAMAGLVRTCLSRSLRQGAFSRLSGFGASAPSWQYRCFSAAPRQERVIAAVERYMKARKDDLLRDSDSGAENREESLKALDKTVSVETRWEELKFDDIDKVEVLLEVEDEFSHVIPDADADSINSVQEILSYLDKAGVN
ncbi:unnamed protein product [Durusdinium trenchii]|uniref:Uncharacterized protein n=2 Tax=Durusdinium trenchii TaxID=1381693 RepID=A0ABP0SR47_9DINO